MSTSINDYTMIFFAESIKRTIFATLLIICAVSCSNDDNITEIFRDREWALSLVREGSVERYSDKRYNVKFAETTFTATMPGGATISGKWEADGSSRSFRCWNVRTDGSIKGDTIAEKMLQIFTNATSYDGDTNWLQIKQQKNVYMQFYSR